MEALIHVSVLGMPLAVIYKFNETSTTTRGSGAGILRAELLTGVVAWLGVGWAQALEGGDGAAEAAEQGRLTDEA